MATQRSSFSKIERARTKQAKAAAKRQKRADRGEDAPLDEVPAPAAPPPALSTAEVLRQVEDVHQQYEAAVIDFETFEQRKSDLLAQLTVD